ncbi:MAG: hypothetical protein GWN85_25825, partial [Gemmatimonadetes bacterium]|nr:hypothetical protein [Gemmatimonadota bacterium]NIR38904.1 hypothetical protein [Actinomycetota bacterium]NIU68432.1 hypothetical protein [Actinomycetota bacterium]NIW30262.1 hypothetical protein [Actinomycetota bacterium]NIX22679.1 hypothetical protein [Actinomycetota bacterium]
GRTLASLAEGQDLTVFAHYDTDTAGHRGDLDASVAALELLDRFLGGVFDAAGTDTDVFMASDHGNIESVEQGHTTNPALGLWLSKVADSGPDQTVASITDVAPWVMGRLGRE